MRGFCILVEGLLDEAVGRRLIQHVGSQVNEVYGKRGWTYIRENIEGFNGLAQNVPLLVLVDLMDTEFECPVNVLRSWINSPGNNLAFRLVVQEVESWLLADRTNISRFLGRPKSEIPRSPEDLDDPKRKRGAPEKLDWWVD